MTTGSNLRALMNLKCDELVAATDMFRTLLPHATQSASIHNGEEGRYVEALLAGFLRSSLPKRLCVGTGFVVNLDKRRRSHQTDILVYDASRYAPYLRYGDAVVLPAESVVAAISVKKRLRTSDIVPEAQKLGGIGAMCGGHEVPPPYLCLFGFESGLPSSTPKAAKAAWHEVETAFPPRWSGYSANELLDSVMVLGQFYLRKRSWTSSPQNPTRTQAKYVWSGANLQHRNAYLQELIHSVHSRYEGRCGGRSPAQNTAHFPSNVGMQQLKPPIQVKCDNRRPT